MTATMQDQLGTEVAASDLEPAVTAGQVQPEPVASTEPVVQEEETYKAEPAELTTPDTAEVTQADDAPPATDPEPEKADEAPQQAAAPVVEILRPTPPPPVEIPVGRAPNDPREIRKRRLAEQSGNSSD